MGECRCVMGSRRQGWECGKAPAAPRAGCGRRTYVHDEDDLHEQERHGEQPVHVAVPGERTTPPPARQTAWSQLRRTKWNRRTGRPPPSHEAARVTHASLKGLPVRTGLSAAVEYE